jgi:hypothetical protein
VFHQPGRNCRPEASSLNRVCDHGIPLREQVSLIWPLCIPARPRKLLSPPLVSSFDSEPAIPLLRPRVPNYPLGTRGKEVSGARMEMMER